MGVAPTVSLNFWAKPDRDIPTRSASSCKVQGWAGSSCIDVDGRAHLLVRQREEPSDAPAQPFRQMRPQGLDQHHVGEVLEDQEAARLRLAQLLHHPLDGPAQRQLVRFFLDVDDRREHSQQDAGVIALEAEVAADAGDVSSPIPGGDATIQRPSNTST